jgi:Papain-like cysteine protease AvrRpt2
LLGAGLKQASARGKVVVKRAGYLLGGAAVLLIGMAVAGYFFFRPNVSTTETIGAVLTDNGFVELRPPSNLFLPGAWVEVLSPTPLRLSVICGPTEALGLSDQSQILSSGSATVSFQSKLAPKFALDAATLSPLKATTNLAVVRDITLSLSNIKLLEVADDVVFGGFKKRSPECGTAIGFRIKEQKNPVSMVKSALVADVEYAVEFNGSISGDAKAKAASDLALNLGVKVDSSDVTKTQLVGQGLVWGIRDDSVLARFGYGLPPTGGSDAQKSILVGHGPVVGADLNSAARRTFSDKKALATYDVHPLKQTTAMGCWATVYTMLKSWKDGRDWTVGDAVEALGSNYVDQFVRDKGLPGGGEREFVRKATMVAEPPADYTLRGYVDMLKEDGPLWVTLGDGLSSHALILVGVYGSSTEAGLRRCRI